MPKACLKRNSPIVQRSIATMSGCSSAKSTQPRPICSKSLHKFSMSTRSSSFDAGNNAQFPRTLFISGCLSAARVFPRKLVLPARKPRHKCTHVRALSVERDAICVSLQAWKNSPRAHKTRAKVFPSFRRNASHEHATFRGPTSVH